MTAYFSDQMRSCGHYMRHQSLRQYAVRFSTPLKVKNLYSQQMVPWLVTALVVLSEGGFFKDEDDDDKIIPAIRDLVRLHVALKAPDHTEAQVQHLHWLTTIMQSSYLRAFGQDAPPGHDDDDDDGADAAQGDDDGGVGLDDAVGHDAAAPQKRAKKKAHQHAVTHKFHNLLHNPAYIRLFGSFLHNNSSSWEQSHKVTTKDPVRQIRQWPDELIVNLTKRLKRTEALSAELQTILAGVNLLLDAPQQNAVHADTLGGARSPLALAANGQSWRQLPAGRVKWPSRVVTAASRKLLEMAAGGAVIQAATLRAEFRLVVPGDADVATLLVRAHPQFALDGRRPGPWLDWASIDWGDDGAPRFQLAQIEAFLQVDVVGSGPQRYAVIRPLEYDTIKQTATGMEHAEFGNFRYVVATDSISNAAAVVPSPNGGFFLLSNAFQRRLPYDADDYDPALWTVPDGDDVEADAEDLA